jgi:hypothetical protein
LVDLELNLKAELGKHFSELLLGLQDEYLSWHAIERQKVLLNEIEAFEKQLSILIIIINNITCHTSILRGSKTPNTCPKPASLNVKQTCTESSTVPAPASW